MAHDVQCVLSPQYHFEIELLPFFVWQGTYQKLITFCAHATYLEAFLSAYLERKDLAYFFSSYCVLIELICTYFHFFRLNK